ncbi:MAG: M50 family metallopeptidase [Actinomycetales bacterium]
MTTDPWVVAVSAAAAGCLVVVPRAWSVSRHVSTIVHEAGHAVVAFLTGRRLAGIRLHSDSSGVTVSVGRPRGPGMVAMLAAGYPASAALGVAAALMLRAGYVSALLWCLVGLLGLMVVQVRNWFGAWSVLVSGVVVFAVTWWLPPRWQAGFAYLVTWFLLFAGPREVVGLYAARRRRRGRRGAQGSDADQLARLTGVPAAVWVAGFFVVCLAVAVVGARLVL